MIHTAHTLLDRLRNQDLRVKCDLLNDPEGALCSAIYTVAEEDARSILNDSAVGPELALTCEWDCYFGGLKGLALSAGCGQDALRLYLFVLMRNLFPNEESDHAEFIQKMVALHKFQWPTIFVRDEERFAYLVETVKEFDAKLARDNRARRECELQVASEQVGLEK